MPPALAPTTREAVGRLVADAPQPVTVLTGVPPTPDRGEPEPSEPPRTVVLVADDVARLRLAASVLPALGSVRAVGVVVAAASAAPAPQPSPAWPPLLDLDSRLDGATATTLLTFAGRLDPRPVLVALARAAGAGAPTGAPTLAGGPQGVWVAGSVVPPLDPLFGTGYDPAADCPPDVVVTPAGGRRPEAHPRPAPAVSPVTGRAPSLVEADDVGEPIDEALFNPIGFRRRWSRGMVRLGRGTRLAPSLVASLRGAQGARLARSADPVLAAGLAMSGVPLERVDDEVERERHAVRARRAAMLRHATFAWRARLGAATGVRHELLPGATVVSTSDDTDRLDLLLARRWSGADLVVMPHDDAEEPERWLAPHVPLPPGETCHAAETSVEEVRSRGGTVYVTRAVGRG